MQHRCRVSRPGASPPHADQLPDKVLMMSGVSLAVADVDTRFGHQVLLFGKMLTSIIGQFRKNGFQSRLISRTEKQVITYLVDQLNQMMMLTIDRCQAGFKTRIPDKSIHGVYATKRAGTSIRKCTPSPALLWQAIVPPSLALTML